MYDAGAFPTIFHCIWINHIKLEFQLQVWKVPDSILNKEWVSCSEGWVSLEWIYINVTNLFSGPLLTKR